MKSIKDLDFPGGMHYRRSNYIALNDGSDIDPTMDFKVEQKHIDGSIPEDERSCALALAINEQFAGKRYVVEVGARYVSVLPIEKGYPAQFWMLLPKAVQFVQDCYDGKPVKPFVAQVYPWDEPLYLKLVYWVDQVRPRNEDDLYDRLPEHVRGHRFQFDAYWNVCDQEGLIEYHPDRDLYTPSKDGRKPLQEWIHGRT